MRTRVLLVLSLLALALGIAPAGAAAPRGAAPHAVVALVDTGIDPYHPAFRDTSPRAYRHPSTYLAGYPRNAVALRLGTSFRADCDRVWRRVRPGVLYWFPGTKIVGAVSYDLTRVVGECTGMAVYDEQGHGTMTASRAAGNQHGACPACLVVSVQFQTGYGIANMTEAERSAEESLAFTRRNVSWIDAESNSWGPLPVYDATGQGGLFFDNAALTRSVEAAASAHLAFWSTGNGVANFGGGVGMPTTATAHFTPSVIRVGGQDSGYVETWPGLTPHLVGDACESWAAQAGTTAYGPTVGSGTSAAAPYVAGGAAATLLAARRLLGDTGGGVHDGVVARGRRVAGGPLADGVLTLAEWRALVLATATARPAPQADDGPDCALDPLYWHAPVRWTDVPAGAPEYPFIGYGAIDQAAVSLASAVLAGRTPLPDRAGAYTWFAADRQVREAAYAAFTAH